MSLYAEYVRERTDKKIIESEHGFAVYSYQTAGSNRVCYIEDIYVRPDFRKNDEASSMANKIAEDAKANGCKTLLGSVCPRAKGSTVSLKVLLGYGFSLSHSDTDLIWFIKEIE